MSVILIIYLIVSYLSMWITSGVLVGTIHKPTWDAKLFGAAIVVFAPVTFLLGLFYIIFVLISNK